MDLLDEIFTDIRPLNNSTKEIINCTFVNTPEKISNKKCIVNIKNNGNRCFQYSIAYAFHRNKINTNNPNRVSNVEPYINDGLNWKDISFPSTKYDYKRFEKNNKSIALFILNYGKNGEIEHFLILNPLNKENTG